MGWVAASSMNLIGCIGHKKISTLWDDIKPITSCIPFIT
jgi:hypothetical protein